MVDGTELNHYIVSNAILEFLDGLIERIFVSVVEDIVKHEETRSGRRRRRRGRSIRINRKIKVLREMDIDALFQIELLLLEDELGWDSMLGNRKTRPSIVDDKVSVPVGSSDLVNTTTSKRCVCKN